MIIYRCLPKQLSNLYVVIFIIKLSDDFFYRWSNVEKGRFSFKNILLFIFLSWCLYWLTSGWQVDMESRTSDWNVIALISNPRGIPVVHYHKTFILHIFTQIRIHSQIFQFRSNSTFRHFVTCVHMFVSDMSIWTDTKTQFLNRIHVLNLQAILIPKSLYLNRLYWQ